MILIFPIQIIRPINYLIRLNERESIVIYIEGIIKYDTISVCNYGPSNNNLSWYF